MATHHEVQSSSRPQHRDAAFSLVEVVLAIGIATFGLLVILSLIPAGLSVMRDASQQIVETEIFNTVGAELASTPFDRVEDYVSERFPAYFDNEGLEVESDSAIYTVTCDASPAPEFTAADRPNGELRRVIVKIGFHQDPDAPNSKSTQRAFLLVDRGI